MKKGGRSQNHMKYRYVIQPHTIVPEHLKSQGYHLYCGLLSPVNLVDQSCELLTLQSWRWRIASPTKLKPELVPVTFELGKKARAQIDNN